MNVPPSLPVFRFLLGSFSLVLLSEPASPREFSLGFGIIKASFWRFTKLLPEVSPVCARTAAIFEGVFPTSASLLELSLETRYPREFSLGFGTIKATSWRCSGLLLEVSPVFDRTETSLGEMFSTFTSLPELSLKARPPCEFSLGFGTIKASSWRCSGLLPGVSPGFDRTETILGETFFTSASLPELSLEVRPPREFSLGFGTTKASSGRCSSLLWGVSPVSDRTETMLGEIFSTFASLPELSLEARPPREFSPGFGIIKASSGRCSGLLLEVSPVFDRTETSLGEMFSTFTSLPELSLKARPPREFSLGFGTIKASSWRCSGLLPGVSPGFDRTETILGEIFFTSASFPELSLEVRPPREFSLGFGTTKASSGRCGSLLWGVSPVFDRTETSLGEMLSTCTSLPELSLKARPPREFSLGFGTIKASSWRCSGLLPGVSPVFDRTETSLGEMFFTSASLPELSLEVRPPREFSLGFGTIKASSWRCSGLLPGVSPGFDRTETILGKIFFTSASHPELSLEVRPPREFSLGFGTTKASSGRCSSLLWGVSPVFDRTETMLGKIFSTFASHPELSLEARPP